MYLCHNLHWDFTVRAITRYCQLLEERQVYESCLDPFLGDSSAADEQGFNRLALSQSLIFLSHMVDTDTQSLNSSICDFLTILHFQLSDKISYSYPWSGFIKDNKLLLSTFYTLNLCSTFQVFANSCLLHQFVRCLVLAVFQISWHIYVQKYPHNYRSKLQFASPIK